MSRGNVYDSQGSLQNVIAELWDLIPQPQPDSNVMYSSMQASSTIGGKFIPRCGAPPEVDDREVLCLCLLQEWLGFESDHSFYEWFENNLVMCDYFPRRIWW